MIEIGKQISSVYCGNLITTIILGLQEVSYLYLIMYYSVISIIAQTFLGLKGGREPRSGG